MMKRQRAGEIEIDRCAQRDRWPDKEIQRHRDIETARERQRDRD